MVKCKYCGADLLKNDKYCFNCGENTKYSDYLTDVKKREDLDKEALKLFNSAHFNGLKHILEKELEYLPINMDYNINHNLPFEVKVLELLEQSYEMMDVYEKLVRIDFPILENQLYDMLQFRFKEDALIKLIIILDNNGLLKRKTVCGLTFIEKIDKDLKWGNLIEFPFKREFKLGDRKLYLLFHNHELEYGYNPYIISDENIKRLDELKETKRLMKIRDKQLLKPPIQELSDFLDVIEKTEKQLKKLGKRNVYYKIVTKTVISLYNKAFMLTNSNRNRGFIYNAQGKHYENIRDMKMAYTCYKYARFFNKRGGSRSKYKELREKYGKSDKVKKMEGYKYRLLKNVSFLELTAKEIKYNRQVASDFELNGRAVSKQALLANYYGENGYNVIDTEFLYYFTYLLFMDIHEEIEVSVNTTYHKDEVIARIKELEKSNLKRELKKAFDVLNEENPEDININDQIYDILVELINVIGEDKILKLVGRNRLNQIYDCKYLPCKGIPSLFVYNSKKFFFAEIFAGDGKFRSRQIYWHFYICEKLDIPLEIALLNRKKDDFVKIYYDT